MQCNDMIFAPGKYSGKTLEISRSSADLQLVVAAEVGCISGENQFAKPGTLTLANLCPFVKVHL